MTYPGFAAVLLGISIATLLYYMFASGSSEEENYYNPHTADLSHQRRRQSGSSSVDSSHQRRRQSCSSSVGAFEDCTICLNPISVGRKCQLRPCKHIFHMDCINKWMTEGPQDSCFSCPNCRRQFRTAS